MREKIESIMHEEGRRGWGLLRTLLYILSLVYRTAVKMRLRLYYKGVFKTRRLPCRVISVGNITSGGSGKTPIAMHLALMFRKNGKRAVIISRGYRGTSSRGVAEVSDGENVLLGPEEAGDEPYLMARRLKGIPVVVGSDRFKAGEYAVKKFSPDYIILDDGFQHLRLFREFDILLLDAYTGFGNEYLLPRGILREPLEGIKRADMVIVKGDSGLRSSAEMTIKRLAPTVPLFRVSYRPSRLVDLRDGRVFDPTRISGTEVVALAGIAFPESFLKTIEELKAKAARRMIFPDHHIYTPADMEKIRKEAGPLTVITTEKDGVKIEKFVRDGAPGPTILAMTIDTEMDDQRGFEKALQKRFIRVNL